MFLQVKVSKCFVFCNLNVWSFWGLCKSESCEVALSCELVGSALKVRSFQQLVLILDPMLQARTCASNRTSCSKKRFLKKYSKTIWPTIVQNYFLGAFISLSSPGDIKPLTQQFPRRKWSTKWMKEFKSVSRERVVRPGLWLSFWHEYIRNRISTCVQPWPTKNILTRI